MLNNIYLVTASRYKWLPEKYQMNILEGRAGFNVEILEGDTYKDVLYPLVDMQCLPVSLGGSYNVNSSLYSPSPIPTAYYLKVKISVIAL